jgi:hypothetical protein
MKTDPKNIFVLAIFAFGVLKLVETMQAKVSGSAIPPLPPLPAGGYATTSTATDVNSSGPGYGPP